MKQTNMKSHGDLLVWLHFAEFGFGISDVDQLQNGYITRILKQYCSLFL
jgi:hypothetical protein